MKVRKLPNGMSVSVHFQRSFAHRMMPDATGSEEDPIECTQLEDILNLDVYCQT
jgi:hypothetical protein